MTQAAQKKPRADPRKAMLAKVAIARKELALTEEDYRAILQRVTGKDSAAKCNYGQLDDLLKHFRDHLGWKPKRKQTQPARAGSRPLAPGLQRAKVRALWLSLYHLGEVRDPSEAAMDKYCARMVKVDSLRWVHEGSQEIDRVIRGLRGWARRVGIKAPTSQDLQAMTARRQKPQGPVTHGLGSKILLILCQWDRLVALQAVQESELADWLYRNYLECDPVWLSDEKADRIVEALGKWIRRGKAEQDAAK